LAPIAVLRCGLRTVQRWEQLGLPVTRPNRAAGQERGLVVADSERLDSWVHRDPVHGRRSDIAVNVE
jgi:hypothetical protein